MYSQVPNSKKYSNRKGGGSGADLAEFSKLNREDLMRKIKSLALMNVFLIVVELRYTSRSDYQVSSFFFPKFRV